MEKFIFPQLSSTLIQIWILDLIFLGIGFLISSVCSKLEDETIMIPN